MDVVKYLRLYLLIKGPNVFFTDNILLILGARVYD